MWAVCVEVEKLYTTYFRIPGDFYCFRLAAFSSFTLYAKASLRRSGTGLDRPSGQSGRGRAGVLGHGRRASAVWVPGGLSRVERGFGRGRRRQRVKVPLAAGQVIRAAPFPSGNGAPRAERRTAGTASAGLEAGRRGDGTMVGFTVGYSVRPGMLAREGSGSRASARLACLAATVFALDGTQPAGSGNGVRRGRANQPPHGAVLCPGCARGGGGSAEMLSVLEPGRLLEASGASRLAAARYASFPGLAYLTPLLFSRGLNPTQQYFVFSVRASHEL